MKIEKTAIPEVLVITPKVFYDERGFFIEAYNQKTFEQAGLTAAFVQDNHSKSSYGALRGLHYQIKYPQGKLIKVISGEIFDVAVDLKKSSPTFGKWVSVHLSAENKKMLWVPKGFAHGFKVLSKEAEVIYKCTDFYAPLYERSIKYDDKTLAIAWPKTSALLLSAKDKSALPFCKAEVFF